MLTLKYSQASIRAAARYSLSRNTCFGCSRFISFKNAFLDQECVVQAVRAAHHRDFGGRNDQNDLNIMASLDKNSKHWIHSDRTKSIPELVGAQ